MRTRSSSSSRTARAAAALGDSPGRIFSESGRGHRRRTVPSDISCWRSSESVRGEKARGRTTMRHSSSSSATAICDVSRTTVTLLASLFLFSLPHITHACKKSRLKQPVLAVSNHSSALFCFLSFQCMTCYYW